MNVHIGKGHTVPNLIRNRQRLLGIISRQSIGLRAAGARIADLKGQESIRSRGRLLTPVQQAHEAVEQMAGLITEMDIRLSERDQTIAHLQARLEELRREQIQADAMLTRSVR